MSWQPYPTDDWLAERHTINGPWPEGLAIMDLRFWADTSAPKQGQKTPSRRALARLWGWSPSRVDRLHRSGRWRDPAKTKSTHAEAAPTHAEAGSTQPTMDRPQLSLVSDARRSSPDARRSRSDAPLDTRARQQGTRNKEQEEKKGPPHPDWVAAVESYNLARGALGLREHKPDPKRGNGVHILRMLKRYGLQDTVKVFKWWSWQSKDKVRKYYKGPETLLRHFEQYRDNYDMGRDPSPDNGADVDAEWSTIMAIASKLEGIAARDAMVAQGIDFAVIQRIGGLAAVGRCTAYQARELKARYANERNNR